MTEKFPKSDRILKRDEFRHVYNRGRKQQYKYFTAFVLANETQKPRIGITTTRKMGNSIQRNRSRRFVREAFRKNKWLATGGVDIVINVKREMLEADYAEFEIEFKSFLQKAGEQ